MLNRTSDIKKLSIGEGQSLSQCVDMSKFSGGILKNDGSNFTGADLCFEVCESESGTFTKLKDKTGALIKLSSLPTDGAFARVLPDEVFAIRFFKLRSITVDLETNKNQTNAQNFTLILKS